MNQTKTMLRGEADAWLARNRDKLGVHDPVSDLVEQCGIVPANVLEIGCANGWRLSKLKSKYGCKVAGIDPSHSGCVEAHENGLMDVVCGTADALPFGQHFDLLIYGFCLYLCEPADYFRIVAEGDRVLKDGAHIVIHDFLDYENRGPFKRAYSHAMNVWSYHLRFQDFWLAHPFYKQLTGKYDASSIVILRKNINAIPERP